MSRGLGWSSGSLLEQRLVTGISCTHEFKNIWFCTTSPSVAIRTMQGNLVRDIGECCGVRVSDGSSVSGMGKHAATTQSAISYPDSDVLDLSPVYHPQMMALIVQSGRWARRGEANVRIPSESREETTVRAPATSLFIFFSYQRQS